MGYFQELVDKKRKRELERINKEIEELKRKGPDFVQRERRDVPKGNIEVSSKGGGSMKALPLVWILIIIIIGGGIYHFIRLNSLSDGYEAKKEEVIQLQEDLANALSQINATVSELEVKEKVEANLSMQYIELQVDLANFKILFNDLNKTVFEQEETIAELNNDIDDKDDRIKELKDCIKNNSISDKDDCL